MGAFFSRLTNIQVFLLLAAAGFCVYANALFHPFVHDDVVFIQANAAIARWDNILEAFLVPGVPFASLKLTTPYYRPLLEVVYRLEFLVFGMNPAGFHCVNILWHILNSFCVFFAVLAVLSRRSLAFAAAALFLVHPVNSEAVACVAGISNLVVTFFCLIAFLAYHAFREGWGWPAALACLVSAAAALLAKEQAVILPLLLLIYEVFRSRRNKGKIGGKGLLAGLLALTAAYFLWRSVLFPGSTGGMLGDPGELWLRLLALPRTLGMYVGLVLWPEGLHYYRSVNILDPAGPGAFVFAAGLAAFAVVVSRMSREGRLQALWGVVWFLIALLPMMNIVPLVNEYAFILTAEHFLYLPVVGLLIALVALAREGLGHLYGHVKPFFFRALFFAVLGALASVTVMQNSFWRGEVPLFERTLQYEPGLGRVHLLLAKALVREGRFDQAFAQYTISLKIMREYVTKARLPEVRSVYLQFIKTIHFDRGQCFTVLGDLARANDEYLAALAVRPAGIVLAELDVNDAEVLNNLGMNFIRLGDRGNAKKYFERAVMAGPAQAAAMNNLGMFWTEEGNATLARFWFERSLKAAPGFGPAWENLKRLNNR